MIPGTTPTFVLTLKNAQGYLSQTVALRADIRQQDVLIQKGMEDLVIDTESNSVAIYLTQKDTLKFLYKKGDIEIQLHGVLNDDTTWKTYAVSVPVNKTLTKDYLSSSDT